VETRKRGVAPTIAELNLITNVRTTNALRRSSRRRNTCVRGGRHSPTRVLLRQPRADNSSTFESRLHRNAARSNGRSVARASITTRQPSNNCKDRGVDCPSDTARPDQPNRETRIERRMANTRWDRRVGSGSSGGKRVRPEVFKPHDSRVQSKIVGNEVLRMLVRLRKAEKPTVELCRGATSTRDISVRQRLPANKRSPIFWSRTVSSAISATYGFTEDDFQSIIGHWEPMP